MRPTLISSSIPLVVCIGVSCLTSCASDTICAHPPQNLGPANIAHVVLVDLEDDADIRGMQAACDEYLHLIPGVQHYICGAPVDIGRTNVATDYDLGIVVQFCTVAEYKAYLAHPLHTDLVAKWKPKWKRSYIVDFGI